MLGEFLEENCPDVTVQVVIKSNEDWGEYIDAVRIFLSVVLSPLLFNRIMCDRFVAHTASTSAPAHSSTPCRVR